MKQSNTDSTMLPLNRPGGAAITPVQCFARMPDSLRTSLAESDWAAANVIGRTADSFIEGPAFDAASRLYLTDIPHGRILRIEADASWTVVAEYDGEPNGLKCVDASTVWVTDYRRGLVAIDIATGRMTPLLSRVNSEAFKGLNDLTFDPQGRLYFTDQGQTGLHDPTGRVYRRRGDGQLECLLDTVPSPNGIVTSPDGRLLFIAATRDNAVWRGVINANGLLTKVGRFFAQNGPGGPDGLAMTADGDLIAAFVGSGLVWRVDPLGRPVQVWDCSAFGSMPTNVAIEPGGRRLFITESFSGSVLVGALSGDGAAAAGSADDKRTGGGRAA